MYALGSSGIHGIRTMFTTVLDGVDGMVEWDHGLLQAGEHQCTKEEAGLTNKNDKQRLASA